MTCSHGRRNLAATRRLRIAIICFTCAFGLTPAKALVTIPLPASASSLQIVAASDLPDAPEDTQSTPAANSSSGKVAPADAGEEQQTKRILWIMPNFRAVSTGTKLPKQSVKEKFKTAALDSFDYSSFVFAGIQAGISQATDAYPEFHQGLAGYGRYYWHTFADQTDENIWVEGILPSVLHQDSRYYTLGHGGFVKRGFYAVTRIIITRTDSGGETFNASEVVGAGAAAAISSAYYPLTYQNWTKIGQRWLTNILLDGGTFGAKEFWPDVNRAIFHQRE
jgi:hypothetical protein